MKAQLLEALMELERTTGAVLAAEVSDVAAICQALERRAEAIARVAVLGDGMKGPELSRARAALELGGEAARKLLEAKRSAAEESTRCRRILKGLESTRSGEPPRFDYSA